MIIQAELRRKQSEYEGEACSVDKVKLSRGKSLLLIAVLIVGLTATVMAAHLLGIGDLLLFPKQRESGEYAQGEVVPKPCMIGLSGYMNTPEGQALSEWSAFLNQYDPDGTIASSLGTMTLSHGRICTTAPAWSQRK